MRGWIKLQEKLAIPPSSWTVLSSSIWIPHDPFGSMVASSDHRPPYSSHLEIRAEQALEHVDRALVAGVRASRSEALAQLTMGSEHFFKRCTFPLRKRRP